MTETFDGFVEAYHQANTEFARGNPVPLQQLFSHGDDVTLLAPSGGLAHGWEEVTQTQERNAAVFHKGGPSNFECVVTCVTPEFAFIVEVERHRARVGGSHEIVPVDLRVTTICRPEDGTWKVVHRHADRLTELRLTDSVIGQ